LKGGWAKSKEFLEGKPTVDLVSKGGVGEVWVDGVVDDSPCIKDGAAITAKEGGGGTKEAATCIVNGTVTGRQEEVHLEGPRVARGRRIVCWGIKSMVSAKLRVDMVVPFLEGKGETLFVEEFRVEGGIRRAGYKDDLEAMCAFVI
jgi:hypothetical protein